MLAKNLANAIFGLWDIFQVPKVALGKNSLYYVDIFFQFNVCYKKFVTHLLLYTVANVRRIFRNRR